MGFSLKESILDFVSKAEKWDFTPAAVVMLKKHPTAEEATEWELTMSGGDCPICKQAFVKDTRSWKFGTKVVKSLQWVPGCKCYRSCLTVSHETFRHGVQYREGCGRRLIVERLMKLDRCTGCGGRIL